MKIMTGAGMRFFCFLFYGLILFAPINLNAQEWRALTPEGMPAELAFIYYARGQDFSHILRGQQTIFSAEVVRRGSIILDHSGVVQTGAGTTLEIQLVPSGAVIKLSENTSLIYNGVDRNGGFADIGLLHGRIRVVSGEADPYGIHPIVVRSGRVVARIIEGDMGIEYVLEPGDQNFAVMPVFRISALRGSAEVHSHGAGGTGALFTETQIFSVEQGESLSLNVTPAHTFVGRMPLSDAITSYWRANNFVGIPPLRMPNTVIAALPDPVPQEIIVVREVIIETPMPPAFQPAPIVEQPTWNRRLLMGIGLGMIGASVAVQGLAHYSPHFFPNDSFANNMHAFSYAPLITGVIFSLIGTLFGSAAPAR